MISAIGALESLTGWPEHCGQASVPARSADTFGVALGATIVGGAEHERHDGDDRHEDPGDAAQGRAQHGMSSPSCS